MPLPAPSWGRAGERESPSLPFPRGGSAPPPSCSGGTWPCLGLVCLPTQPVLLSPTTPQLQQALAQLEEQDTCFEFRQQQLTVHRVHITFLPHKPPPAQPHDVTLVAQLSMER